MNEDLIMFLTCSGVMILIVLVAMLIKKPREEEIPERLDIEPVGQGGTSK